MPSSRFITLTLLVLVLLIAILLAGFVPQDEGFEVRRTVSNTIANLRDEDFPKPIESLGDQAHLWSIRRQASLKASPEASKVQPYPSPVYFSEKQVTLLLAYVVDLEAEQEEVLVPLLALDGISQPELMGRQASQFDVLDLTGDPVRFRKDSSLQAGYTPFSLRRTYLLVVEPEKTKAPKVRVASLKAYAQSGSKAKIISYKVSSRGEAQSYQDLINTFAKRYDLEPHLLKAIIQSESNFNPRLVSPKQAVGLMQVLPSTAGGEVHRYLHGKRGNVSRADLHNPEVNIRYGTTYLHILKQNYFSGIKDKQALEYCTVAAYNMGPNRVVRSFGSNPKQAAEAINNMSSEQVYQHLISKLPRKETRNYVAKVRSLKQQYQNMPKIR